MRNGRAGASCSDPESERFIVYADAQILRRRGSADRNSRAFRYATIGGISSVAELATGISGFLDFPETAICFPAKPNQIPCSLTQGMAALMPSYY
jgi:hypothetical protein